MPLYNKKKYVRKTLDSVLSQTFPFYEVVIVDDGSTDGSLELVKSIKSDKIKIISQENSGPGIARNRGVAESTYSWVAFIDADDIWDPEHLSELERLRKIDIDAGILATRSRKIRSYDDVTHAPSADESGFRYINYLEEARKRDGVVHTSAAMINKEKFQKLAGFPDFMIGEDVDLWIRASLHYRILGSDRNTAYHFLGTGGLMDSADLYSSSKGDKSVVSLGGLNPLMGSLEAIYSRIVLADESRKKLGQYINSKLIVNIKVLIVQGQIPLARQVSRLFLAPMSLEAATYRVLLTLSPVWLFSVLNRSRKVLRALIK